MSVISLAGSDQYYRSVDVLPSRLINMIRMNFPNNARTKEAVFTRPGTATLATLAASNVRGMAVNYASDELYVVSGNKLYELNTSYAATERGTLATSSGHVRIKVGLDNVAINETNGGAAYEFIPSSNTFSTVNDGDFPTLTDVEYVDNFFIGIEPSTRNLWISSINDFSAWDALDFAAAESQADNAVGIVAHDRDVWIFKQTNTEIWYNSGDVFPFDRREYINQGCIATLSPIWCRQSVYWLGMNDHGSVGVYKSNGYTAEPISTTGISYKLESLTAPSDAEGYCINIEGNDLLIWTFPTDDLTIVYNRNTNSWSEWQDSGANRFALTGHVYFNDTHIIGDPDSGIISSLSFDNVDDAGTDFNWEIITPTVSHQDRKRLFNYRIEADFEAGGGANDITLLMSKDGGNNFTSLGTQAATSSNRSRAFWRSLGAAYNFTYKFTGSSDQAWRLLSLVGEYEVGEF